jgi:anti-sigma factor ChrR (cupin superfamily)
MLAARMLAAAAAVPQAASSQTPSSDAELEAAREQWKTSAQQIAKVNLPTATEPAFHFKA